MRQTLGPATRAFHRWFKPRFMAGIVSALFVAEVASATLYDAVADFNATGVQMPGATWAYGKETSLNGVFSLLPDFGVVSCDPAPVEPSSACRPIGATVLSYFAIAPLVGYGGPDGGAVGKNVSTGTIIYPQGAFADNDVVFPANVLGMGPAGLLVTRWTAPMASTVNVTGFFQDLQAASVGLYVVVNGKRAFASSFGGGKTLQGQIPFSLSSLNLSAGDTIDFVVDSQGGTDDDLVGLSAKVSSAIPEPVSFILFMSGLVVLVAHQRCRHRRATS